MGQLSNVRIPGWGRLLVLPLVLSLVLLLPACGSGSSSAPTALSVGGIRYSELELGLLNERARHELGVLTGFALLAAQDEFEELVRPFVERETRSILLQQLRTEIAWELGEVRSEERRVGKECRGRRGTGHGVKAGVGRRGR